MGFGVPLGAKNASHDDMVKPGRPASTAVGISGAAGRRLGAVTANALMLPACTSGSTLDGKSSIRSIWPATRSCNATLSPRYGTRRNLAPDSFWKNTAPTVEMPPAPVVPNVACPGWVLSQAISSFRLFAGRSRRPAIMNEWRSMTPIGSKSFAGS